MNNVKPIKEIVFKIASTCNLACKYCYMYELAEGSKDFWYNQQPPFTNDKVVHEFSTKLAAYWSSREIEIGHIYLHGGEPLLVGAERLDRWLGIMSDTFSAHGLKVTVGLQTNGILFNRAIGDVLRKWNVTVGVSLDGVPEKHDDNRIDHRGIPSGNRVVKGLNILTKEFSDIFSGFLCVVDIAHEPREVAKYLLSYEPKSIDFLLPLDNWDRRPKGLEKVESFPHNATPYGDWLSAVFDEVVTQDVKTSVRVVSSLINRLISETNTGTLLGDEWDVVSLRADGGIELLDTFLASDSSIRDIGLSLLDHDFFDVEEALDKARMKVVEGLELNSQCKECPYLSVCGGSIIHSRYSTEKGFSNPSIYCGDMKRFIDHGINFLNLI